MEVKTKKAFESGKFTDAENAKSCCVKYHR